MSYREFLAWQKFMEIRPFGDDVIDLRFGQIAAIMHNAWRDKQAPRTAGDYTFEAAAP